MTTNNWRCRGQQHNTSPSPLFTQEPGAMSPSVTWWTTTVKWRWQQSTWLTNDCKHPRTKTGDDKPRWARSPHPQKLISLTGNPGATSTATMNNVRRHFVFYGTTVSNPPLMFIPTHLAETQDKPRWEAHLPPPLTPLTRHPGATLWTVTWQPNDEWQQTSVIHCCCVFGHQLISGRRFDGEYWRWWWRMSLSLSTYYMWVTPFPPFLFSHKRQVIQPPTMHEQWLRRTTSR